MGKNGFKGPKTLPARLVKKVSAFFKGIPRAFLGLVEKIVELPSWLEDARAISRKKRRMKKRKEAQMKRRLSEQEYQRYVRKKILLSVLKCAAGVLCAAALVFAVRGIGRGIGYLGGRLRLMAQREAEEEPAPVYEEKDVTIAGTGCMLLHGPILNSYGDEQGNYDFSSIYKYIAPYYSAPDLMTCEFEGSLAGEDYSGYPVFKSPDAIIENIRDSGVDLQLLATNHTYDGGADAFARTLRVYAEKGIPCTGVRGSTQDKPYYIADIKGVSVGFVDYVYETEGEGVDLNGIPLEAQDENRVNTFDYDYLDSFYNEMNKNIRDMKADGARFIVANLHWGEEYHLEESDYQREIAQKLCDLGVDALIGGHPHCEQPIDVFTGRKGNKMFCIFSVGNALTNQRAELIDEMPTGHTEDGVVVTLHLHQSADGTVSISDVELLPTWVYRYQDNGSRYFILPLDDVPSLEEKTGIQGIQEAAQASYDRTMGVLGEGLARAKEVFGASAEPAPEGGENEEKS